MPNPTNDEIKAQLEKILGGRRFAPKTRLSPLLRYLVETTIEGKGATLTERNIAKDQFEKPDDWTGENDSCVRSSIHDLRVQIKDYYQTEGMDDQVIIDFLAVATDERYAPRFRYKNDPTTAPFNKPQAVVAKFTPITSGGYHPIDDPELSRPKRCIATLEVEFNSFENILMLEEILQKYSGDPSLRLLQFRISSILPEFECSEVGYKRLLSALKTGVLGDAIGCTVASIQTFEEFQSGRGSVDSDTYRTRIIDLSKYPSKSLFLGLPSESSLSSYLESITIEVTLLISPDAKTWHDVEGKPIKTTLEPGSVSVLFPSNPVPSEARFICAEFHIVHAEYDKENISLATLQSHGYPIVTLMIAP